MLPHLGAKEVGIILVIALMGFGGGKLPGGGSALGKGIKESKKATNDEPAREIAASTVTPAPAPPPPTAPVGTTTAAPSAAPGVPPTVAGAFCPQCGAQAAADTRFCARCGASIPTAAV